MSISSKKAASSPRWVRGSLLSPSPPSDCPEAAERAARLGSPADQLLALGLEACPLGPVGVPFGVAPLTDDEDLDAVAALDGRHGVRMRVDDPVETHLVPPARDLTEIAWSLSLTTTAGPCQKKRPR
jgi:hypothetical protein